ncbi:MAG: galactokinase [Sphaerochaetaceae bacterium]|nr:galactokinase [Sphaerochaetaceae bacterium]NLY06959.1 galactokinase [Spirochaetales bacterium]
MNPVVAKHFEEYSQEPLVIVEVPGVSILFGEFADFCKGHSVCAANSLRLEIGISLREDNLVKMSNAYSGDHKRFSLSGIKFRKEDRWGNFIKGVALGIQNENHQISGLNITFTGSLLASDAETVAAGMGIGVAIGLNKLFDLHMERGEIIRHVYLSNTGFCQENCRYMVLMAMLDAKQDHVMLFDNQQVSSKFLPFSNQNPEYRFCIVESRIQPSAMREELRAKEHAMKKAFAILKKNYPNISLREVPESELSERVIRIDEESRQICSYILEESRIAKESFKCLEADDVAGLGKLMNRVQKGLRDKLDLTCPEVDWLVKRANEISGCIGSCLIPTGLAGSILMLMNANAYESFQEKLADYEHIFGFSAQIKDFSCSGPAAIVQPV